MTLHHSESLMLGKLCRSENSGVAELKEDGQVSCDTAQNLRLTFLYITPHARAAARPHAGASTSLAFSSIETLCCKSPKGPGNGRVWYLAPGNRCVYRRFLALKTT